MSGNHARLAFSGAPIWVECPGSIRLSEGLPPEADTAETLEGNAADWVAKQYAAGNEVPYGSQTPIPGYPVDYSMIAGAKLWTETIGYGSISGLPVSSRRIHPTDAWGEPDGWVFEPIQNRLKLPDYKYGFEIVEPDSWQLTGYIASVLEAIEKLNDPDCEVWSMIVQPRAWHPRGPVRTWKTTVGELRAYINIMSTAAHEALPPPGSDYEIALRMSGQTPRTKTGSHCTHCRARFDCTTLQQSAPGLLSLPGRATRANMDAREMGLQLRILREAKELIEAAESGLATKVEGLIRSGAPVKGWKLATAPGKRAWNKGTTVDEVLILGQLNDPPKDMHKPPTLTQTVVTPTQAIEAGVSELMVKSMSTQGNSTKLVLDDGTDAARVFGAAS